MTGQSDKVREAARNELALLLHSVYCTDAQCVTALDYQQADALLVSDFLSKAVLRECHRLREAFESEVGP